MRQALKCGTRFAHGMLLCVLCIIAFPAKAALDLQGNEEIVRLLKPYLPADAKRQKYREMVTDILGTEGYFAPQISFKRVGNDLQIQVDPGEKTKVVLVNITIIGADGKAVSAEDKEKWQVDWPLPVGETFQQSRWNTARQLIINRLISREFADAKIVNSLVDIDPVACEARVYLEIHTGQSYRMGALQIEGLQRYSPELIARYNRHINVGDVYEEEKLFALQSALQSTPYFSSVQLSLNREKSEVVGDSRITPIKVVVRERAAHRISTGVGISSNTGARIEAFYKTPNLFDNAWLFEGGTRIEQKRQTLYGDVFLPPNEKNQNYGVGSILERSDIENLKISRYAMGVQRVQQRGTIEERFALQWQLEQSKADGSIEKQRRALVPNLQWTWRKVDTPQDPKTGQVVRFEIGGATKALLSDQNFVRLYLKAQHFFPLSNKNILSLRYELGHNFAKSKEGIPEDYLFRAGGTGSIRGYNYQSIGVKEGNAVVGGRYLAIGSVELIHWLSHKWGAAAFVDAGDAYDSADNFRIARAYGMGVRWKSPAGPLGADIAYGERDKRFRFHFALSIPF